MQPEIQTARPPLLSAPGFAALAGAGVTLAVAPLIATRLGFGLVDDAYISLRYAANWAGGRGLVFNPGERVEGYTNFLWVLIEAAAIRLGADPEAALTVAGFAALAMLAGGVAWLVAAHTLPGRPLAAATAGLLVALHPWCWPGRPRGSRRPCSQGSPSPRSPREAVGRARFTRRPPDSC